MTIQEVCQRLGKSESTIRRWIRQGKLTSTIVDGKNQIPDDQVDAIADARSMTGQVTGQDELVTQLKSEVEYLRQEMKEQKERSDTIIMNLSRQLESQQQQLLEYKQPWYRRVFRKRRQEPEG